LRSRKPASKDDPSNDYPVLEDIWSRRTCQSAIPRDDERPVWKTLRDRRTFETCNPILRTRERAEIVMEFSLSG